MKKISLALLATSLLALTVFAIEVRSEDSTTTTTTTTKKHSVGEKTKEFGSDVKEGTENAFKDLGKGVKKVGSSIDHGAKSAMRKVTPHKKHQSNSTSTTETK